MARFNRFRGRRQVDPLDDLGRSLRTKEPTGRRPPAQRRREATLTSRGLQVVGAMAVIALALLAVSTVMLWRIADRTSSDGGGGDRTAEPPALPPASKGSSTRTLTREFDKLSETFATELDRVNAQLGAAAGAPSALEQQFSGATRDLGVLADQSGAFEGANRALAQVARSTRRLAPVQASLRKMRGDLSTLDTVAGNTGAMNASIASMNDQLRTLEALSSQMQSMNASLATLGPMNASLTGMSQSLETLNAQMTHISATMDAVCDVLTDYFDCPE